MFVPLQASTTGTMSIAGHRILRLLHRSATSGFKFSTNLTASLGVMFIFQFPAIIFFLAIFLSPFYLLHSNCNFFVVSAATPGSSFPSRNSREAPPPVEICVILSPYRGYLQLLRNHHHR